MQNLTKDQLKDLIKESIREVLKEEGILLKSKNENPILNQKIKVLNLLPLVYNALIKNEIYTITDLIMMSKEKVSNLRNIGKKGVEEVELKLKELNLELIA